MWSIKSSVMEEGPEGSVKRSLDEHERLRALFNDISDSFRAHFYHAVRAALPPTPLEGDFKYDERACIKKIRSYLDLTAFNDGHITIEDETVRPLTMRAGMLAEDQMKSTIVRELIAERNFHEASNRVANAMIGTFRRNNYIWPERFRCHVF